MLLFPRFVSDTSGNTRGLDAVEGVEGDAESSDWRVNFYRGVGLLCLVAGIWLWVANPTAPQ
jgi:hypothetical protein